MKTKKVNDKAWKAFVIGDIFEMTTGASISKNEFSSGNIPRVTASDNKNGIGLFTNRLSHKNFRTNGNFISYSFLGSAFYHEYDVSLDMKIHGLKIKGKTLNKYLGQFLVTCLRHTILTPSYGNQISSKDLLTKKILLPISELGDPDWEFMEDYTRNKFRQIKKSYKSL
ncbi:restriction endonuclease subunit S, partial [Lactococcus lactis]